MIAESVGGVLRQRAQPRPRSRSCATRASTSQGPEQAEVRSRRSVARGLTFVLTGTLPSMTRDEAQAELEARGGKVTGQRVEEDELRGRGREPGLEARQGRAARRDHPRRGRRCVTSWSTVPSPTDVRVTTATTRRRRSPGDGTDDDTRGETMADDSVIGKRYPGYTFPIERGKIREFAQATMTSNPDYLDDPAAGDPADVADRVGLLGAGRPAPTRWSRSTSTSPGCCTAARSSCSTVRRRRRAT